MKYVLSLLSLILLSGCSTISDYQAGCYDALDASINVVYNSGASKEQNDELRNNIENFKIGICRSLHAKQRMRFDK